MRVDATFPISVLNFCRGLFVEQLTSHSIVEIRPSLPLPFNGTIFLFLMGDAFVRKLRSVGRHDLIIILEVCAMSDLPL